MATTLPDSEYVVRAWLRQYVAADVFFELPRQTRPSLPLVTVTRVGGPVDGYGWDHGDYTLECWGETKKQSADLAKEVVGLIVDLDHSAPYVDDQGSLVGGSVGSVVPLPGTSWAKRYAISVWLQVRSPVT